MTTDGVWMTRRAYIRLQAELAALRSEPGIEVPDDLMDYDDEAIAARRARIARIDGLLANAIVGEDPPDDGIAEPGMVLTVRLDGSGRLETFLMGVRGLEDADIQVYSAKSPLGSAIIGARIGEQRVHSSPSREDAPVTLLEAIPYGAYSKNGSRAQSVSPQRIGMRRELAAS